MSDPPWQMHAALPLLLELTRALRARRFYLPSDPALGVILTRSAAVWASQLRRSPGLYLEVLDGSFVLPSGRVIRGPGVDELSRQLFAYGVRGLVFEPGLVPEQFRAFVDVLARMLDAAASEPGLLPGLLRQEGIRRIRIRCEGGAEPFEDDGPEPVEELFSAPIEAEPAEQSLPGNAGASSPAPSSEDLQAIDFRIASLERARNSQEYARLTQELEAALAVRMEDKDFVDAYRAALVLGRHTSGLGPRFAEARSLAREALHRFVLGSEELVRIAVQRAYAVTTGSTVEAVQLLVALGSEIVPRLLDEHTRGTPEAQRRTPSILVAMADSALPVLLQEIASAAPARIRRAVSLLGAIQHPRAEPFLSELLATSDPGVRREAARALARIPTERSLTVLREALEGPGDLAECAAYGLGWSPDRRAVGALCAVLEPSARRPERVRHEAATSLGRLGDVAAIGILERVLEQRSVFGSRRQRALRCAAAEALGRIGGVRAQQVLRSFSQVGDSVIRAACAKALGETGATGGSSEVGPRLADGDPQVSG